MPSARNQVCLNLQKFSRTQNQCTHLAGCRILITLFSGLCHFCYDWECICHPLPAEWPDWDGLPPLLVLTSFRFQQELYRPRPQCIFSTAISRVKECNEIWSKSVFPLYSLASILPYSNFGIDIVDHPVRIRPNCIGCTPKDQTAV